LPEHRRPSLNPGVRAFDFHLCATAHLSYRSEVHELEGEFDMARITPNEYCVDDAIAR
jgi:hypothetical protein